VRRRRRDDTSPDARERGATLVEYSLVVAVLLVGSIAATQFLEDKGEEQTLNEVECISSRPAPVSCQIPAIVTTTSSSVVGPPPEEPCEIDCDDTPGPMGDGTSAILPQSGTHNPNVPSSSPTGSFNGPGGTWYAQMTVYAVDTTGAFISGAVVNFTFVAGTQTIEASCTTNASGQCTVTFTPPFATTTTVIGNVSSISSGQFEVALPSPSSMTFAKPT
jgi:hypothetical protein